jgi:hypothetical protein
MFDSHISCRSPAATLQFSDANTHKAYLSHAVTLPRTCRSLERLPLERHGRGMAGERHGNDMACVNLTRPHCVNQMGKTQSKPLVEPHGRGTAWERHGMCESNTAALCKSIGKDAV